MSATYTYGFRHDDVECSAIFTSFSTVFQAYGNSERLCTMGLPLQSENFHLKRDSLVLQRLIHWTNRTRKHDFRHLVSLDSPKLQGVVEWCDGAG